MITLKVVSEYRIYTHKAETMEKLKRIALDTYDVKGFKFYIDDKLKGGGNTTPPKQEGNIMENKKDTFTFSKCLFDCNFNDWGVDKYESESGQIKLVVTNIKSGDTDHSLTFKSDDEYEKWIDRIVSDEDAVYNKARALLCVLSQLDDGFGF